MPKGRKSHKDGGSRSNNDVHNMMGMFGMDDNDLSSGSHKDLEDELAQILGEGGGKSKAAQKPKKSKLMDWGELDSQIASSLRDVSDSDDDEGLDDADLLNELEDISSNDLAPPTASRRRSPSPQPQGGSDILSMLQDRKSMYDNAIANAKAKNESSKVRRLTRGQNTLLGLIKQAKAGKNINEDEIPPPVATGSSTPSSRLSTAQETPPLVPEPAILQPSVSQQPPMIPARSAPVPPPKNKPTDISTSDISLKEIKVDNQLISDLEKRKREYMEVALKAKHSGDKTEALRCLKVTKQFDAVITAAKNGQKVDLSKMPPSPHAGNASNAQPAMSSTPADKPTRPVVTAEPEQPQAMNAQPQQQAALTPPKTVLEGLLQRQGKYKSTASQSSASKQRRMTRIVKQYDEAIKAHKAGKIVNFDELPVPPGYPPLPGVNEAQVDTLAQAEAILVDKPSSPTPTSSSLVGTSVPAAALRPKPQFSTTPTPSQRKPAASSGAGITAYDQQIDYLRNREKAFKAAALEAKKKGDRETALEMLRCIKKMQPMIEQAKRGMRIDITDVPQPPLLKKNFDLDDESSSPRKKGLSRQQSGEEDDALYIRLLNALKDQVKKARGYSQQFTHAGDVAGADTFDKLSDNAQRDYDIVRNKKRHNEPPPRFHYETKQFECVHINPELNSNEMEIEIIQLLNLPHKDVRPIVEWELPYPHDNPSKGKTDECKSETFQFNQKFRLPVDRRQKSFQGTIKRKSLKIDVVQKGGFLRSSKVIGSAAVKLLPLENTCELHAVEELKEGRQLAGKVDVKIRLRTPLVKSESSTVTEQWLVIDHKQSSIPTPSTSSLRAPKSKTKIVTPKNLNSLEVLGLERKMVDAKAQSFQRKGQRAPQQILDQLDRIQADINSIKKFLKEGGAAADRVYTNHLKQLIDKYSQEAQIYQKQGKLEQVKYSLTKKKLTQNELSKVTPSTNTYL